MKPSSYALLAVLFTVITTMSFRCVKDSIFPTYDFLEKFTLTPYKKVYHINDTITLRFITASKSLYDKLSNNRVATDTTNFVLGFQYIQQAPYQTATDTLTYAITPLGVNTGLQLRDGNNYVNIYTNCDNSPFYRIEIAYVPKKTGVYTIHLPLSKIQTCPAKKEPFPASFLDFSFDLADCNKDVYMTIPPAQRKDSSSVGIALEVKKVFAFRVE